MLSTILSALFAVLLGVFLGFLLAKRRLEKAVACELEKIHKQIDDVLKPYGLNAPADSDSERKISQ